MSVPPPRPANTRLVRFLITLVTHAQLAPRLVTHVRHDALARVQLWSLQVFGRPVGRRRQSESAQGTVEYALVLLGAAAVALLLVAWVARTDLVGRLFDTVVGKILGRT